MSGQVAIVTGASRGIGRGVAVGLGEAGWTVYVTARTVRDGESDRPGSVTKTAEQVTLAGGRGIAMRSDHSVDSETEAVFRRVEDEQGGLDLLVNNATSYSTDLGPREDAMFWDLPVEEWDQMHAVGLRSHYVASACAARMMVPRRSGLIVNISSMGAIKYTGNVSYNVVKAAVDMLTLSTAEELRPHQVAVVSFWPRLTRTEALIAHPEQFSDPSKVWSAEFNGRCVAALANDPRILDQSGKALELAEVAVAYGLSDSDGRVPELRSRA
ncbi:MAG: SDR family NAD(P)-dependent oxidoreductase [Candidatus Dormibacteraceae bacterium]